MAIRKSVEDSFVVAGPRETWLAKCNQALIAGKFTALDVNQVLFQVKGNYKKVTVWGSIEITLAPEGNNTRITAKAMANVDNIFALFSSPGKKILYVFKSNLK